MSKVLSFRHSRSAAAQNRRFGREICAAALRECRTFQFYGPRRIRRGKREPLRSRISFSRGTIRSYDHEKASNDQTPPTRPRRATIFLAMDVPNSSASKKRFCGTSAKRNISRRASRRLFGGGVLFLCPRKATNGRNKRENTQNENGELKLFEMVLTTISMKSQLLRLQRQKLYLHCKSLTDSRMHFLVLISQEIKVTMKEEPLQNKMLKSV